MFHEGLHELLQSQQAVASADAGHLVVAVYAVGFYTFIIYKERNRLVDVNAELHRRGMVGQYGNAHRLLHLADGFIHRFDEPLVQVVDGAQLQLQVAVVAGLVGCLYVNEDEVVRLQGFDGGLCLAFIIGVGQARGSRYFDDAQAGIAADALNEVDGRDDGSCERRMRSFSKSAVS